MAMKRQGVLVNASDQQLARSAEAEASVGS